MNTLSQKRAAEILNITHGAMGYHLTNGNIPFITILGIRHPIKESIYEIKPQLDLVKKGELMGLPESCLFLNIHDSRFRRYIEKGAIPHKLVLGKRYWSKIDLEEFNRKYIEPTKSNAQCISCGKDLDVLRTAKLFCSRKCKMRENSRVKYYKNKSKTV